MLENDTAFRMGIFYRLSIDGNDAGSWLDCPAKAPRRVDFPQPDGPQKTDEFAVTDACIAL